MFVSSLRIRVSPCPSCSRFILLVLFSNRKVRPGASFQLFLGGPNFFKIFNATTIEKLEKNTLYIYSNLTSFTVPFFLFLFFLFFLFLSFFSFFLFPWGRRPPPAPLNDVSRSVLEQLSCCFWHLWNRRSGLSSRPRSWIRWCLRYGMDNSRRWAVTVVSPLATISVPLAACNCWFETLQFVPSTQDVGISVISVPVSSKARHHFFPIFIRRYSPLWPLMWWFAAIATGGLTGRLSRVYRHWLR